MKSVLKYIGMKDINLNEYGFNNEGTYCEPFSGSFNTGLRLYEKGYTGKLIYNDSDIKVVNFWLCIKENNEELLTRIDQLNSILKKYCTDLERIQTLKCWEDSKDNFKRAAAEYVYRQHLTLDGLKWNKYCDCDMIDFYLTQEAMQSIDIYNLDYIDIINKYDSEDTFFLIDPPYDICRVDKYYRGNCKEFNHEELSSIIKHLKGNWLLTYNDNLNTRELYKEFRITEVTRKLLGNSYTELYITKQ